MPTGASGTFNSVADCSAAFWMRRSISRMSSRYSPRRARSLGSSVPPQPRHLVGDRIENAAVLLLARQALRRVAAVAEQPLEDDLRAVLHRQRQRGRAPGDRVVVGAAVAGAAVQRRLPRWPARSTAAACPGRCARPAPGRASSPACTGPSRGARRSGRPPPNARGRRRRPARRRPADAPDCSPRRRGRGAFRAASGVSGELEARSLPSPASTCPSSRRAGRRCSRTGSSGAPRSCASAVRAGTIESSSGSASVTPVPRRNVRRGRCFLRDERHHVHSVVPCLELGHARAIASRSFTLTRI